MFELPAFDSVFAVAQLIERKLVKGDDGTENKCPL